MQIYFLTVLANILAGLVIANSFLKEKIKGFDKFSDMLENRTFKLWLGIAVAVIGILSFFKFGEKDIVIIGDLLPSLSSLFCGFVLISQYIAVKSEGDDSVSEEVSGFFKSVSALSEKYNAIIGITAIIIGILHMILPSAVIL